MTTVTAAIYGSICLRPSCSPILAWTSLATAVILLGLVAAPVEPAAAQTAPSQQAAPAPPGTTAATDLSKATPEDLMLVYRALRSLSAGAQSGAADNVVWKRDAGTFRFKEGRITLAAPVAGRVVAAVFTGQGVFELNPPTPMDRRQVQRFARAPKLEEPFREAVFFFSDDSQAELEKLVHFEPHGDAAAGKLLESAEKKYQDSFNQWWSNEAKDNPPVRNLAARLLSDLSDPTSRGLFLADIATEHDDDLLFQVSWNRDPIVLPGITNGEEVELVRAKRNEYTEWWAGFHVAGEYASSPHPEHTTGIAHCASERIDAEIAKDNRLSATAEMEYQVPGGTPRVLALNLEGVLRISAVTDEAGRKLLFIQEDREHDSDPWVVLPEPAAPGRTYKLKIAYDEDSTHESRIIHQQGSGLYFVTARESWYPSFGSFDRTLFHLHFTSPKKFKLVATGRPVSAEKAKDDLETEWESEIPYGVAGFNYGDFVAKVKSDADLTVTAYAGREVPDELKGVEAAMRTSEMAQGAGHSDIGAATGILTGGFNTAANAQYAAAESYQAFKLYESYFGPLPFKTISVTEQPVGFFGQSWPTLIFLPYTSLLDSTTRNSLRMQDSAEEREFYNVVAVHEMSHQWWGHMVGWKTYHDQWLSEGFADFSAGLYVQATDPKKFRAFRDLKRKWLLSNNGSGHRPVDAGPVWLSYQTNARYEPRNSMFLIYYKGAYILQMLRLLMEDPRAQNSDGRFIAMMRDFVATYAAKNASTEDFRRVVEKHMGEPMGWFFDEWVYGTETPRYDFSYDLKDAGGGKTLLHASLTQSEVSDDFFMKVPLYIYINGTPRRLGFVTVKGSTTANADVPLPLRPDKVTLDEYHCILANEK